MVKSLSEGENVVSLAFLGVTQAFESDDGRYVEFLAYRRFLLALIFIIVYFSFAPLNSDYLS